MPPALKPPVQVRLIAGEEHDCSYLPGRPALTRAFWAEEISPEVYHDFMDAGFRRSGRVIYQPACHGCRECVPIRIPVDRFKLSKSQRRCRRRNSDLRMSVGEAQPTHEKYDLYRRYVTIWHGSSVIEDWASFTSFLYESPVDTIECCYRDTAGRLLGVGICDLCSRSLSTVYFYFEPGESPRGLGTLGALAEIELARNIGIPWYYLGYWVKGCGSMEYKTAFRPYELLGADGVWRGAP